MPRTMGYAALALLTLAAACSSGSNTTPAHQTLALSLSGLPPLQHFYHYQGWAVMRTGLVSTGMFNTDAAGNLVDEAGDVIQGGVFQTGLNLDDATAIVITVEPGNDASPGTPSGTRVLAGALVDGQATLAVADSQALGTDFAGATGEYILATPTDGAGTNENSGIWFLDPAAGPGPGLVLPTLPAGWRYEGWAVIDGTPVSTGKFTSASGADASAPYSGTEPAPPFPGEDFLLNAPSGLTFPTDLAGGTAAITVEPNPDDAPTPYGIKPLVGAIPASATDHTVYAMTPGTAPLPTGTATVQ